MKNRLMKVAFLICCITSLFAQDNNHQQVQSPYFHILTENVTVDHFPLMHTQADVRITGPIADVTVTQVYKNDGNQPIEASYVFPASTRAAVYEMTMTIGERTITAEIQEKKEAKRTYEKAKSEGKRASLLEQHRPNVFQMNVANIMPGDEVTVKMKYNEFLIPESKMYSFVYPTVVGPRYGDPNHQDASTSFIKNPFTKSGTAPSYDLDIRLVLDAAMPIQQSKSITHEVNINYLSESILTATLKKGQHKGGNKDFIFNYSLSDDQISEGTYLYDHGDEKFFLTMIQPPSRVHVSEIPPREYIFVVDISGSMNGFPLDVSKKLMNNLIKNLRPVDKFNILLFAGGSKVLSQRSLVANQKNLKKAYQFLDEQRGSGSTQLLAALKSGLALPSDEEINSRSIIVVTDGYVHVEREAFELIANNLDKSNLFAFGIGSSVNRHLIEGMAHAGQGEAFIITEQKYAHAEAEKFRKYIQTPLLTNIQVNYQGLDVYDVSPSTTPDLLSERPLYIFGKYRGNPKGSLVISGQQGNQNYQSIVSFNPSLVKKENESIRYLWAREKIRWLDDLNTVESNTRDIEEITQLGIKYNLLTKYTSFVAVDEVPAEQYASNEDGQGSPRKPIRVKQVLPLPQGVSNYAVGFEMKSEGSKLFGEQTADKQLFIYIDREEESAFLIELSKLLKDGILFSKEEIEMLDGNTLFLSYDSTTNKWKIKDGRNKLTEEFVNQFIGTLEDLQKTYTPSTEIKINLLWI